MIVGSSPACGDIFSIPVQMLRIRLMMTHSSVCMGSGKFHLVIPTSATWLECCAQNNKNVMPTFLAALVEIVGLFLKCRYSHCEIPMSRTAEIL